MKPFRFSALKVILVSVWLAAIGSPCFAAFSPLSVGVLPPIEFPPDDFTIVGARVSALWGDQRNFYGVDLGLIGNVTQQNFVGLAVSGVFNLDRGMTTIIGLQVAGIGNFTTNKTTVYGLQLAAGVNQNMASSAVVGLELALLNLAPFTNIYGFQAGLYNRAQDVYGFQIGVVNMATSLHGLQIGLLNFNQRGLLAVSPFLNIGF